MNWNDEIAFVTGGGRGIGAATAFNLNALGSRVVITARSVNELNDVIRRCPYPDRVMAIPCDLQDSHSINKAFLQIQRDWGNISILVNNAAALFVSPIIKTQDKDLRTTVETNIVAPYRCTQLAFLQMIDSGRGGSIINISSLGGISGTEKFEGMASYCMSKFAITGLTEASAVEGRPYGIRVNCVAPGAVNTKMLHDNVPQLKSETDPSEIAKIIVFLADKTKSGPLTGAVIPVMSNIVSKTN